MALCALAYQRDARALPAGFTMEPPWDSGATFSVLTGSSLHACGGSGSTQDCLALDFPMNTGVTVRAAAGGTVRWADWYGNSSTWTCYGRSVSIAHDTGGVVTFYAHLNSINVSSGQRVNLGDVIGTAGATGTGTRCGSWGAHLHFAAYQNPTAPTTSPPYGGTALTIEFTNCTRNGSLACTNIGNGNTLLRGTGGGGGGSCGAVSLGSPGDGAVLSNSTVNFSWSDTSGCTHDGFTFRIKTTSDMDSGGETLQDRGVGPTSWSEPIASQYHNRDLYWGVRAVQPSGPWTVRRFRVEPGGGGGPGNCDGGTGVYVYEHPNYQGRCSKFTTDVPAPNGWELGNDAASSVKFIGNWTATLYEHDNYGGRSSTFTADDADLGNDSIGHDAMSSIRVSARQVCSDTNATFVTQSPYPTIQPGQSVNIFMTVRNSGGCEWTAAAGYGYRGTNQWNGWNGQIWRNVPAGDNLTFQETVTPPSTPGVYKYGVSLTLNGQDFGPWMFIDVTVAAAWPTSCPGGQYLAQWYGNRTLSGDPAMVRCESAPLNYDWQDNPPTGANVSQMSYSARWQGTFSFATAGTYRFVVSNDDGMNIWIDGTQVYASWTDPQVVTGFVFDRVLSAGSHVVKIEYYEADGWAKAAVAWSLQSQAPAAPSGLTATATSSTSVRVAWTDNSSNEQAFAIYRMAAAGGSPAVVGTVGAGVTSFVNTGLTPGGQYQFWVAAGNAQGWTGAPAWVTVTLPSGSPPTAPSGLAATALGSTSIRVNWVDNSSNEQVFAVYRSLNGVASLVTTVPAGTTTYTVTGLAPGTPYGFWVAAGNSYGWAGAPAWVAAMTTTSSPPTAPTNVTTEALSAHSILIRWTDASSDEQAFAVYRAPVGGLATLLGTVPANSVSFTDSGLAAGTTYQYWVAAGNGGGWRGAASWVTGRTMGPFVAGITAPTTNPPAGAAYTVIGTSSLDVGPTPYWVQVYNVATGQVIGQCGSDTVCSVQAPALAAGQSVTYRARISRSDGSEVESTSAPLTFTAAAAGNTCSNPALTGSWLNVSGDLTIHVGEVFLFNVHAARTAADAPLVDRVELTIWWAALGPESGPWRIVDTQFPWPDPTSTDYWLTMDPAVEGIPLNTDFKISFNVWNVAGQQKCAPGGVLLSRYVP